MSTDGSILIQINGKLLRVQKGITILQAARQNGIEIPTLCDFPGLPSPGSCRMCIVEIEGQQNTPTSCTTPAIERMVIYTHSPKVLALRKELLQLLLAEHPSACLFCPEEGHCNECMITLRKSGMTTGCGSCPKNEQCELQSLVKENNVEKPFYPLRYRMLPVYKNDPFIDRDDNLCILCGRCIRVCEDLHFVSTISYIDRGSNTRVSTSYNRSYLEAGCTFCGACVEICPTGALTEKIRKWDGKPESVTETTCALCSIGCQINLLSKHENVLGTLPNRSAETNVLCVKGRFCIPELVNNPKRLIVPQKRSGLSWQGIDWDEAIDIAAEKLTACEPDQFQMQISASCSSEDLFVAAQFTHHVMHSRRIFNPDTAHYGSGLLGLSRIFNSLNSLEVIDDAKVIICLGLEDSYEQSVVETHLHKAKKQDAEIIQLGSRKVRWSNYIDTWTQIEHGNDTAAFEQAIRRIPKSISPVIILGPAILTNEFNQAFLQLVEKLVKRIGARVITLPQETNLYGSLQLGLSSYSDTQERQDINVLYIIGADIPTLSSTVPFIIYQNLYLSEGEIPVDLLLPTTAFTEEEGSFIDYAGRMRLVHPAVAARGKVMPSWKILGQIAKRMGVQGFNYTSVQDIWHSAQEKYPGFPELRSPDGILGVSRSSRDQVFGGNRQNISSSQISYMGLSLPNYIEGLRSLYPEKNGRNNEPDY